MLAGLENLTTKNNQSGNRFNGKVDLTRVAAMGYSQGGGGAMAAARDPRVDTTVAIQPWRGSTTGIRVPTLYLAGSADAVVSASSVEGYFNASSSVPAAFGNLRGDALRGARQRRRVPRPGDGVGALLPDGRPEREGHLHRLDLHALHVIGVDQVPGRHPPRDGRADQPATDHAAHHHAAHHHAPDHRPAGTHHHDGSAGDVLVVAVVVPLTSRR